MGSERIDEVLEIMNRENNKYCSDPDLLEILNSMDAEELCTLGLMGFVFSHTDGKITGVEGI